ncbi:MAG: GAF domain-containing protein [Candidatus Zixiibacteriota bacterium]|nr:MAG: GAF domain-containing protein [candidate division Zixibacteria bacterium]
MSNNQTVTYTATNLITDLRASIDRDSGLSHAFFELTRRLAPQFNIRKAVLLLRPDANAPLAAISTWDNGQIREGLALKLPSESSLFEIVAGHGEVYTENFCGGFSGNFFEKKLLLEADSRSFVLHPLKHDGQVIGLLGFSSDRPTAFTCFEEGLVDPVINEFSAIIRDKALRL